MRWFDSIAFGADPGVNLALAVAMDDGRIITFKTGHASQSLLTTERILPRAHTEPPVQALVWSPDASMLAWLERTRSYRRISA